MRDFSIEERLSHPLLSRIGENVLTYYVKIDVYGSNIYQLDNNVFKLIEKISEMNYQEIQDIDFGKLEQHQTLIFALMMASNTNISIDEKFKLASAKLRLSDINVLYVGLSVVVDNPNEINNAIKNFVSNETIIEFAKMTHSHMNNMLHGYHWLEFNYNNFNTLRFLTVHSPELAKKSLEIIIEFFNIEKRKFKRVEVSADVKLVLPAWLLTQALEEKPERVKDVIPALMVLARDHENTDTFKQIVANPQHRKLLINKENFYEVAKYAHFSVLSWFYEELQAEERQSMLDLCSANWRNVFYSLADQGNLKKIQYLAEIIAQDWLTLIIMSDYKIFIRAVKSNRYDIVQWLAEKSPDYVSEMMSALVKDLEFESKPLQWQLIQWLIEKTSIQTEKNTIIWQAITTQSIQAVIREDNLAALHWIQEHAPGKIALIHTQENFDFAIKAARYEILQDWLETESLRKMVKFIAHNYFAALKNLIAHPRYPQRSKEFLVFQMFTMPSCFRYAEELFYSERDKSRENFILKFIEKFISKLKLRDASEKFVQADINFLFYVIKAMIRRKNDINVSDLEFLLKIPALHNILHIASRNNGMENELLIIALRYENYKASLLLLAHFAVRDLAARNNFYATLKNVATDPETAVYNLTAIENLRLKKIIERYQPKIDRYSLKHIIIKLRYALATRFIDEGISIKINGKETVLPLHYADLLELQLSKHAFEMAMHQYYLNANHCAWRLLSANPWMADNIKFVRKERTAVFSCYEDHLQLIALAYLAAADPDMPPIDGYSLSDRLDFFVNELAGLMRAHNMDIFWIRKLSSATPVITVEELYAKLPANLEMKLEGLHAALEKAQLLVTPYVNLDELWEEFLSQQRLGSDEAERLSPLKKLLENKYAAQIDDLKPDYPSCSPGYKTRLFRAVQGHPLFSQLKNSEIFTFEIKKFMRAYFNAQINEDNKHALKAAFDNYKIAWELREEDQALLKSLDIPEEAQLAFRRYLVKEYQEDFLADLASVSQFYDAFYLDPHSNSCFESCHVMKMIYLGLCKVDELVEERCNVVHLAAANVVPMTYQVSYPGAFFEDKSEKEGKEEKVSNKRMREAELAAEENQEGNKEGNEEENEHNKKPRS